MSILWSFLMYIQVFISFVIDSYRLICIVHKDCEGDIPQVVVWLLAIQQACVVLPWLFIWVVSFHLDLGLANLLLTLSFVNMTIPIFLEWRNFLIPCPQLLKTPSVTTHHVLLLECWDWKKKGRWERRKEKPATKTHILYSSKILKYTDLWNWKIA